MIPDHRIATYATCNNIFHIIRQTPLYNLISPKVIFGVKRHLVLLVEGWFFWSCTLGYGVGPQMDQYGIFLPPLYPGWRAWLPDYETEDDPDRIINLINFLGQTQYNTCKKLGQVLQYFTLGQAIQQTQGWYK